MKLGRVLIYMLVALLGAGILVVGVSWYVINKMTKPAAAQTAPPLADQKFMIEEMPRFLIKLNDKDKVRYLDTTLQLVLSDDKNIDARVKKVMPFLQDKVQGYLMDRTSLELNGQAGKDLISTQVLDLVHKVMGEDVVKQVLVNKMVVQ